MVATQFFLFFLKTSGRIVRMDVAPSKWECMYAVPRPNISMSMIGICMYVALLVFALLGLTPLFLKGCVRRTVGTTGKQSSSAIISLRGVGSRSSRSTCKYKY